MLPCPGNPCPCDLPRCPVCNYTEHDASFNCDHHLCTGKIPITTPVPVQTAATWACWERQLCSRRHEPSDEERVASMFSIGGKEERVDTFLDDPVLVGVALTKEAAEAWRDERPLVGIRRYINDVPLVGAASLTVDRELELLRKLETRRASSPPAPPSPKQKSQ